MEHLCRTGVIWLGTWIKFSFCIYSSNAGSCVCNKNKNKCKLSNNFTQFICSTNRSLGYPDDVGTYGMVSGLWTSMTALGFFIGSVAGGILLALVGFQLGTLFILGAQLILV